MTFYLELYKYKQKEIGGIMLDNQEKLVISNYSELYDILIKKDHPLRQILELVDFTFVVDAVKDNYSENMGRKAEDPIPLFKYLMLKDMYELSDRDLIERTLTDLSFKYFLGLAPEETKLIHPTTLTKFRRLRLKSDGLLNLLIQKSLEIAVLNGIDLGKTIIVDATHTHSKYNKTSIEEILLSRAKKLRKEVYKVDEEIKKKFPKKRVNPTLKEVIVYCEEIVDVVKADDRFSLRESIKKKLHFLQEGLEDTEEALKEMADSDAKVGHKSADDPFFGYKTHISCTENRLIAAAKQTSGEKADGKEFQDLVEQSIANGVAVEEALGDTAYSGKDNLKYCEEHDIRLISKLNPVLIEHEKKKNSKFEYNKDAGLFVCPAGHLASRKATQGKKNINKNQTMVYYFDVEKCKVCPQKEGCYKEGAKSKTYSLTIKTEEQERQKAFQETEYFKNRYKQRYIIEAKNGELKNQHGYDRAVLSGLFGMRIQGAVTMFNVNIKRILTILRED